jgi:hypothetical protein
MPAFIPSYRSRPDSAKPDSISNRRPVSAGVGTSQTPFVPSYRRPVSAKPRKSITTKAYVLPMIGNKYVVGNFKLKNGKFEKTFIGGGCGDYENIRNCAIKELGEESKETIRINNRKKMIPLFSFISKERFGKEIQNNINNKRNVTLRYTVFKVDLSNKNFNKIKSNFKNSTLTNKKYMELNNIHLMSLENLRKANMWNFMKRRILSHLK